MLGVLLKSLIRCPYVAIAGIRNTFLNGIFWFQVSTEMLLNRYREGIRKEELDYESENCSVLLWKHLYRRCEQFKHDFSEVSFILQNLFHLLKKKPCLFDLHRAFT